MILSEAGGGREGSVSHFNTQNWRIVRALWSREMYGPDRGVSGSSQDLMHETKDRLISFKQGINIKAQYFLSILAFAPMGIDHLLRATQDRVAFTDSD